MKFALYVHIWLSLIAMLLTAECSVFFLHSIGSVYFLLFSGAATLFAYNAHTLIALYSNKNSTELTIWANAHKVWVFFFALTGLVLSVGVAMCTFSRYQWFLLCFGALLWILYEIYIARTNVKSENVAGASSFVKSIILAFVWTVITSMIPLVYSNFDRLFEWNSVVFIGIRFCLFACITQLFEYRDLYESTMPAQGEVKSIAIRSTHRAMLFSKFFIAFIVALLFFVDTSNIFIVATSAQLVLLAFFIRIRNIVTIAPSMILWDGVLIISPVLSILYNQL